MATTVDFVHAYTAVNNSGIADIIRRGCLDFKLDPKFDLHFTKYRVRKPDEVIPIDLNAFLYDHILKVDY